MKNLRYFLSHDHTAVLTLAKIIIGVTCLVMWYSTLGNEDMRPVDAVVMANIYLFIGVPCLITINMRGE